MLERIFLVFGEERREERRSEEVKESVWSVRSGWIGSIEGWCSRQEAMEVLPGARVLVYQSTNARCMKKRNN